MGKIKRGLAVLVAALLLALAIRMSGLSAEGGASQPATVPAATVTSAATAATDTPAAPSTPAATGPLRVYLYPAPPDSAEAGVTVYTSYLAGEDGVPRQAFAPGEAVRPFGMLVNPGGAALATWTVWTLSGPCGSQVLWAGELRLEPGVWALYLDGAVLVSCPGAHLVILSAAAQGQTSAHSAAFSIGQ